MYNSNVYDSTPPFVSFIKDTTKQYKINTHYQYNDVTSVYSYIYYIILYISTMLIPYVTVTNSNKDMDTFVDLFSQEVNIITKIYNIIQVINVEYKNILIAKNNLLYLKLEHTTHIDTVTCCLSLH